jgi:hypothetical protein
MKLKNLFTEEYDANARPSSYYWTSIDAMQSDRKPDHIPDIQRRWRPWVKHTLDVVVASAICVVGLFAIVMFFWWGVGGGIRDYQHSQDQQACRVFQEETGHETRFVNYNFWTWDCLTPGFNGKWVSIHSPSLYQPNTTDLNLKNVKS